MIVTVSGIDTLVRVVQLLKMSLATTVEPFSNTAVFMFVSLKTQPFAEPPSTIVLGMVIDVMVLLPLKAL